MSNCVLDNLFYDLLNGVSGIHERNEGDAFLKATKEYYELTNIAYLGVNIPQAKHGPRYVQCIHSDERVKHYVTPDFLSIEPLVKLGLTVPAPMGWDAISAALGKSGKLVEARKDLAQASRCLTFPIVGLRGETAVFSIVADLEGKEWPTFKRAALRDIHSVAHYYHTSLLAQHGNVVEDLNLSPHEIECLKWAAAGKTAWETSKILDISERTVKFHLNAARAKMNCVTTTQAVAKAVASGKIILF